MVQILSLIEAMDQLAIANSMHCYGRVLRMEDGHAMRRALEFEVGGQRRKKNPEDMEKAGRGEMHRGGVNMEDIVC